jgi:hypothetical protein
MLGLSNIKSKSLQYLLFGKVMPGCIMESTASPKLSSERKLIY